METSAWRLLHQRDGGPSGGLSPQRWGGGSEGKGGAGGDPSVHTGIPADRRALRASQHRTGGALRRGRLTIEMVEVYG